MASGTLSDGGYSFGQPSAIPSFNVGSGAAPVSALSSLFQPSAPPAVTQTAAGSTNLPDWYNEYMRGIAGQGTALAAAANDQPIPQQAIAGFNPDQIAAFDKVKANVGSWSPYTTAANGALGSVVPAAAGAAGAANAAVAGPSANWTDPGTMAKYMSPYTDSVVNEIARQGNKNFTDTLMPDIAGKMLSSGQYGSTRNADVLGRAAVDNQANITGAQSQALQSGYSTAGNLFNQDANRTQQQQTTQATTALAGGQLQTTAGLGAGQALGALGQTVSGLGLADAQALQAVGQQQQQLQQMGLDTAYNNTVASNNAGWNNLNNLNSIIRGAQLPTSQTSTTSGPLTREYSASPMTALGAAYATARS